MGPWSVAAISAAEEAWVEFREAERMEAEVEGRRVPWRDCLLLRVDMLEAGRRKVEPSDEPSD